MRPSGGDARRLDAGHLGSHLKSHSSKRQPQRLQLNHRNRPSRPALAHRSILGFAAGLEAATVRIMGSVAPVSEENSKPKVN